MQLVALAAVGLVQAATLSQQPADATKSSVTVRLFMGDQSKNPLIQYRVDLLKAALKADGTQATITGCDAHSSATSDRRSAISVLQQRDCDVIVTSAGGELTRPMAVVPFPIYLGGGGYRVLLMTPSSVQRLSTSPMDLSALRRLTIGSGTTWADSTIMERNQIPVERTAMYTQLFAMLRANRFDALSRSIFEVDSELKGIASEGIVLEKNTLIHYGTDLFFYVAPHNEELRAKLARGLHRMYCDGRMQRFIRSHPSTRSMWSVVNPEARTTLELDPSGFVPDTEARAVALYGDAWRTTKPSEAICDTEQRRSAPKHKLSD